MTDTTLWVYGRASGLVDLALFTLVAVLGIAATSGRPALGISRATLARLHRTVSVMAILFLLIHVITLTLDSYARLNLISWFLPAGSPHPFAYGLGAVALDLTIVVALSGALRRVLPLSWFRPLHVLSHGIYPFALVHTLLSGTDAGQAWVLVSALVSLAVVIAATVWRLRLRATRGRHGAGLVPPRPRAAGLDPAGSAAGSAAGSSAASPAGSSAASLAATPGRRAGWVADDAPQPRRVGQHTAPAAAHTGSVRAGSSHASSAHALDQNPAQNPAHR